MAKSKFIVTINLLIISIIFFLFFVYIQTSRIYVHDLFWPYYFDIFNFVFPSPRIIPNIINSLYNFYLPNLFDIHSLDFRTNIFVCSIFCCFLTFSTILLLKGFFIFSEENKNILKRWECIFLLPFVFLFQFFPFFRPHSPDDHLYIFNIFFMGVDDLSVFFEHCFGFILYVLFLTILFNIILYSKKYTFWQEIFLIILGFSLGFWSEFVNVPLFIGICLTLFGALILKLLKKDYENINLNLFSNSSSKKMVIAFFIGLLVFYFCTGKFNLVNFGTISDYNIVANLSNNLSNIHNFNLSYTDYFFKQASIYWITIIVCIFIITIINLWSKKTFINLFLIITPIISFLISSYLTVLLQNYREGQQYIFEIDYFIALYYMFLGYTVILLLGQVYFLLKKTIKPLVIIFLCIGIYIQGINFINIYPNLIKIRNYNKLAVYKVEKLICIYSALNERVILAKETFDNQIISDDYLGSGGIGIPHAISFLNNRYGIEYDYPIIVNTVDEEQSELNKRLEQLGGGILEINPKYNMFGQIQFSDLRELYNSIKNNKYKI